MFFGELGLDGRLRPVCGVLPAVLAASEARFGKVMVARQNAAEAALVPGMRVIAASSLTGAADWLRGTPGLHGAVPATELEGGQLPATRPLNGLHPHNRRASGAPGSGKAPGLNSHPPAWEFTAHSETRTPVWGRVRTIISIQRPPKKRRRLLRTEI